MATLRPRVGWDDRLLCRVVTSPNPPWHGKFMTLTPDQERIILVSHSCSTELSWPTLSTTEFAACRPAGKSLTHPTMGTLCRPIDHQLWPRRNADTCIECQETAACPACVRNSVHENLFAHCLGPFMWAVFSRGITTPQLNCLDIDPTHHQGIQGLALLRLPAPCRVLADGWELTADDASAAFHTQTIFTGRTQTTYY